MIYFQAFPAEIERYKTEIGKWLKECIGCYRYTVNSIVYNCLSADEMQEANKHHLNHDYLTDIITFNYTSGKRLKVEMLICPKFIFDEAMEAGRPYIDELDRVLIHGLLHCVGFNDNNTVQEHKMRLEEDKCLLLRPKKLKNRTIE